MGEVVRVLRRTTKEHWWRVENLVDGYRGWARSWGLVPVSARGASAWNRRASARVIRMYAEVRAGRGRGPVVSPLFWNARIVARGGRGRWRQAFLPDGRTGWVEVGTISRGARRPGLRRRLGDLLGTPYLWGGRTPLGFDCSGFIQQVLAERGVWLPRDAVEQSRNTRRLSPLEKPLAGDLVFFGPPNGRPSHVGLLLGSGFYAHARGCVRISSLDPHNDMCDKELLPILRGFWRPSGRRRTYPDAP